MLSLRPKGGGASSDSGVSTLQKRSSYVDLDIRLNFFVQVRVPGLHMKMVPVGGGAFWWQSYTEEVATAADTGSFTADGLREQLSVTWDTTDYLWYMTE